MKYTFDQQKFAEFFERKDVVKKDIIRICDISSQSIYRWIRGESDIPLRYLLLICNFYKVPLSIFIIDQDEENSDTVQSEEALSGSEGESQKTLEHIFVEMTKSKEEVRSYEKQLSQLKEEHTEKICELRIDYEKQINQKELEINLLKTKINSEYSNMAADERLPYYKPKREEKEER